VLAEQLARVQGPRVPLCFHVVAKGITPDRGDYDGARGSELGARC
jgi:hypothetical protein